VTTCKKRWSNNKEDEDDGIPLLQSNARKLKAMLSAEEKSVPRIWQIVGHDRTILADNSMSLSPTQEAMFRMTLLSMMTILLNTQIWHQSKTTQYTQRR
jgi:hypothetical protein